MKEKLYIALKSFWNYANSNIGAAFVGASATYILTKGYREEELKEAKEALSKTKYRLDEIDSRLRRADERVLDFVKLNTIMSSDLQNCLRSKDELRYAFDNSMCLFRKRCEKTSKDLDELRINSSARIK
ncbi:MAG: hypothetical protein AB7F64_07145 [Gammaproteobacteria bacterium]